jgi:hypothetical protein
MRRSTHLKLLFVAVAVALAFWACNNTIPTTSTTPAPTTTETFQGTLNPNGARTFSFSTQAAGTITTTLTSVSPDSTTTIGMALGTWNGAACQVILANDNAVQSTVLTGASTGAGSLCVRVYDVGNLTANEDFTVTVEHP